jgi:hypothetical protein
MKIICSSFVNRKTIPETPFSIAIILAGRTPAQSIRVQTMQMAIGKPVINRLFFFFFFDSATSALKRI